MLSAFKEGCFGTDKIFGSILTGSILKSETSSISSNMKTVDSLSIIFYIIISSFWEFFLNVIKSEKNVIKLREKFWSRFETKKTCGYHRPKIYLYCGQSGIRIRVSLLIDLVQSDSSCVKTDWNKNELNLLIRIHWEQRITRWTEKMMLIQITHIKVSNITHAAIIKL